MCLELNINYKFANLMTNSVTKKDKISRNIHNCKFYVIKAMCNLIKLFGLSGRYDWPAKI